MATTKSDLAARAAAVIPGGVNSGQRRVPGLEELVSAATSGATFTDGDANTYTGYHGWHDSVAMNVISLPENVGRKDPLSKGVLPEVIDATIVCRFNDADDVERALAGQDVAAIILEPIPHNIGAVLPRPGFLERL